MPLIFPLKWVEITNKHRKSNKSPILDVHIVELLPSEYIRAFQSNINVTAYKKNKRPNRQTKDFDIFFFFFNNSSLKIQYIWPNGYAA